MRNWPAAALLVGLLACGGESDPIAPAAMTQGLHDYFAGQGADTTLAWHPGGHELRQEELRAVQGFLGGL